MSDKLEKIDFGSQEEMTKTVLDDMYLDNDKKIGVHHFKIFTVHQSKGTSNYNIFGLGRRSDVLRSLNITSWKIQLSGEKKIEVVFFKCSTPREKTEINLPLIRGDKYATLLPIFHKPTLSKVVFDTGSNIFVFPKNVTLENMTNHLPKIHASYTIYPIRKELHVVFANNVQVFDYMEWDFPFVIVPVVLLLKSHIFQSVTFTNSTMRVKAYTEN